MEHDLHADPPGRYNAHARALGWTTRCFAQLDFYTPELNALRDLWAAKSAGGHWPARADFDARALKPFLRNLAIVERTPAPVRYRLRYFGSDFVRLFGEQSDRFIDQYLPEANLPRWTLGYDTVLAGSVPLRFTARFQLPAIDYLKAESFSAPLSNGGAPPDMLLTAMYVSPSEDS